MSNINDLFANEFDTQVLRKKLAKLIGLNEAIVLNQLHYWIEKNKRENRNFHDGKYWVYNSYEDWQSNDFEYWSIDTIKRTFAKLEKIKLVSCGNYNKMPMDRTKWYTINYDELEKIATNPVKSTISAKCTNAKVQNATMHSSNLHRPIPENTKEYLTENNKLNVLHSAELINHSAQDAKELDFAIVERQIKKVINSLGYGHDKELISCTTEVFRYYYWKYYSCLGCEHPILSTNAMTNAVNAYIGGTELTEGLCYDFEEYKKMIDKHFVKDYGKDIDYSICHFLTEGIQNYLFYECCY